MADDDTRWRMQFNFGPVTQEVLARRMSPGIGFIELTFPSAPPNPKRGEMLDIPVGDEDDCVGSRVVDIRVNYFDRIIRVWTV